KVTVASTGESYSAKVLGSDSTKDVALLQLQDASGLEVAPVDDEGVNAGDTLTAIGNAQGRGSLVAAAGRVTATNKSITTQGAAARSGSGSGTETGASTTGESLSGLIEFGADVVSGDSGGPVLDAEGEVAAMTVAASSGGTVVGYAIPIQTVTSVVQQIENKDASGGVRIGGAPFLGVSMQSSNSSTGSSSNRGSRSGSSAQTSGASVAGVVDDTPAAEAGISAGSTITAIDGQTVSSADGLSAIIAKHAVGDQVSVSWVDAQGTTHTQTVTLAEGPVQ
ncbi:MAG: S1C family serine protease, partial [Pseudoclavibacter sp.]